MRASSASEPRDRSAPAKRRARERVGESEGRSPSGKTRGFMSDAHGAAVRQPLTRSPYDSRDVMVLAAAAGAAAICALIAQFGGVPRLQPLVGLIVIMAMAYSLSTNRRAIDRGTVAWGLALQIVFALL